MEKNIQILQSQEVVMTFTYNSDEWAKAQAKEYKKLEANLSIKGFRKGHVPSDIAKRYINNNDVINEAINTLVNASYHEALNEGNYNIFTQPRLSITKLDKDGMTAEVRFALSPKITLGQYKNLDVKLKEVKVTDDDINFFILDLRKRHALMNIKEGEAALGDTVIIDFKGYIDDSPFDGGEAKGHELKLGSNSFVPGFEEQLVGIKAGENRSINITFPKNYVENLAGKEARFEIHCSDVKEEVLPELNEDFFADINIKDVKTEEELRKYAEETLKERKEREAKETRINELVSKIIANSTVQIGDDIIVNEAKNAIERIKKQVESNGLTFKDYLNINNVTEETMLEQQKKEARTNITAYLVIEEICHQENIKVDDKTIDDYLAGIGAKYKMDLDVIKNQLKDRLNQIKADLRSKLFSEFIDKSNPVLLNEAENIVEEEKEDTTENTTEEKKDEDKPE